jgi:hypothetical protein
MTAHMDSPHQGMDLNDINWHCEIENVRLFVQCTCLIKITDHGWRLIWISPHRPGNGSRWNQWTSYRGMGLLLCLFTAITHVSYWSQSTPNMEQHKQMEMDPNDITRGFSSIGNGPRWHQLTLWNWKCSFICLMYLSHLDHRSRMTAHMDLPTQTREWIQMTPMIIVHWNGPFVLLVYCYCTYLILITIIGYYGTTQADGDGSKWQLTWLLPHREWT